MKYIQLFENFKPREDWQVGDIVVSKKRKYAGNLNWLNYGQKYEIVEVMFSNSVIKIKDLDGQTLNSNFFKNFFVTEEEWELKEKEKKYNI